LPVLSTIANCTIKIAFICVNVQNSESFQNSIDNFSKACYNTDILKPTGAATLPEKDEDKIMEKKFALVTEYGEINDSRAIKDIKAGKSSIYEAFDQLNGTRNGSFEEKLYDNLEEAKTELSKHKTVARLTGTWGGKILDCEVSYIEERHYDEDGEYDLAECGNVWAAAEEEIKD
jgi:hypothetical protein